MLARARPVRASTITSAGASLYGPNGREKEDSSDDELEKTWQSKTTGSGSKATAAAAAVPFTLTVMDQTLTRSLGDIAPGRPLAIDNGATVVPTWDIAPDQGPTEDHPSVTVRAAAADTSLTFDECMHLFQQEERLSANNLWVCPVCKTGVAATKQLELFRLPRVLIVQLKRFSYNSYFRDKITAYVDFPVRGLNLGAYLKKPTDHVYDLFAVSHHSGGLGGGHYTAHAYNSESREWLSFDDSFVSAARADDVKSSSSYVLFYILRDPASGEPAAVAGSGAAAGVAGAAAGGTSPMDEAGRQSARAASAANGDEDMEEAPEVVSNSAKRMAGAGREPDPAFTYE